MHVMGADALPALAQIFAPDRAVSKKLAMHAFVNLHCVGGGTARALCEGLLAAGAVAPLLELLRSGGGGKEVVKHVIKHLYPVASEEQRSAIVVGGAGPPFVEAAHELEVSSRSKTRALLAEHCNSTGFG